MNNTLSKILVFAAGATIGSVVTWKLVKTKYEQIAQDEIESVKEAYYERIQRLDTVNGLKQALDAKEKEVREKGQGEDWVDPEELPFGEEEDREAYRNLVRETGYTGESNNNQNGEEETSMRDDMVKPYVITPQEFGDCDYETVTLNYYEGDSALTDVYGDPIDDDDVVDMVGDDFAEHYGEYEQDTVYVRNENEETDYEILRNTGCFWTDDEE